VAAIRIRWASIKKSGVSFPWRHCDTCDGLASVGVNIFLHRAAPHQCLFKSCWRGSPHRGVRAFYATQSKPNITNHCCTSPHGFTPVMHLAIPRFLPLDAKPPTILCSTWQVRRNICSLSNDRIVESSLDHWRSRCSGLYIYITTWTAVVQSQWFNPSVNPALCWLVSESNRLPTATINDDTFCGPGLSKCRQHWQWPGHLGRFR
jgi:hypothetical protein